MKRSLLILFAVAATMLAKAQQYGPYPVIPIDTVQFVSSSKLTRIPPTDSSDYVNPIKKNATYGDTVRVEGIVMMDPRAYGLSISRKGTFIQRDSANGKPWSGVLVLADPATSVIPASPIAANNTIGGFLAETKFYDNLKLGYKVRVTGIIRQFNITGTSTGETQIDMLHDYNPNYTNSVEVISIGNPIPAAKVMTVDSFMTGNPVAANAAPNRTTAEKYAGMYVELRNVTVYTRVASGSRWVWSVIDDNGNSIQIRDFSGWFRNDGLEDTSYTHRATPGFTPFAPPPIGARLSYIRGVITETSSNSVAGYWLAPLSPTDIGAVTYSNPALGSITRNPVVATPTDSVTFTVKTVNGSGKVSKVRLYTTIGYNNFVFDSISLTSPDSITWTGKVPNKAAGSVVKYWVKIIDQNGYFKNAPDSLGTNSAYVVTTNGINTIADLQFSPYPNGATIWNGDSIPSMNITAIVTGINYLSGTGTSAQSLLTIQNGTAINSGMFIQRAATNDATSTWAIGDSVSITAAKVTETFGVSILNSITATKIASGKAMPSFIKGLVTDSFSLNNFKYGMPYEGMLLRWDSTAIVNPNPDAPSNFYEFTFAKDTSNANGGMRVDDMNASIHNVCSVVKRGLKMNFIQGPLFFSHNEFKLIPRSLADIDLSRLDTVPPVITLKGKQYDTLTINKSYVDSGATAFDNIDGNITSKIVRTGTVDSSKVGMNTLYYSVSDAWGNASSINRYVYVKLSTSVKESDIAMAGIKVFPSPAQNEITITAPGIQSLPVNITVLDMIGRELMSRQIKQGVVNEKIDISSLQNGVYFCVISNSNGMRTVKFTVNGK